MDSTLETYLIFTVTTAAWILALIVGLLLGFAYLTYAERKIIGAIQLRKGPNVVGPFGLLQPIADGVKLLTKEMIIPAGANRFLFVLAPMITLTLSLIAWAVIPLGSKMVLADLNVGILYLFAISSLSVYGIIIAGWASNSKYAFLGALRSAAQMVSYEVSIGFVIVTVLLCAGSMNLTKIVEAQAGGFLHWYLLPLLPMAVIFFVSSLAETNRSPFDLPEGESELVGGYFTEYSGFTFAMFYIGEYIAMILMSAMASILFLGGWYAPVEFLDWIPGFIWFALKISFILFLFIWVRATFPRYRYDQLMRLGWKIFLPFSLFWVVATAAYLKFSESLPVLQ
jgi:NADH-quinone oxidoreductase subunit H